MNNNIEVEFEDAGDEDAAFYCVTATRNGISARSFSGDKTRGEREAIARLKEKENKLKLFTPQSPNWENDIISFLCRN